MMDIRVGDQIKIKEDYNTQRWYYTKPLTVIKEGLNEDDDKIFYVNPPLIFSNLDGSTEKAEYILWYRVYLYKKREELRKEKIKELNF